MQLLPAQRHPPGHSFRRIGSTARVPQDINHVAAPDQAAVVRREERNAGRWRVRSDQHQPEWLAGQQGIGCGDSPQPGRLGQCPGEDTVAACGQRHFGSGDGRLDDGRFRRQLHGKLRRRRPGLASQLGDATGPLGARPSFQRRGLDDPGLPVTRIEDQQRVRPSWIGGWKLNTLGAERQHSSAGCRNHQPRRSRPFSADDRFRTAGDGDLFVAAKPTDAEGLRCRSIVGHRTLRLLQ